jgi:Lon protease-like protein
MSQGRVQGGAQALSETELKQHIEHLSDSLESSPDDSSTRLARARAQLQLARALKARSARASEQHALFYFDPDSLSSAAARDAERSDKMISSVDARCARAEALEDMDGHLPDALTAYQSALELSPTKSSIHEAIARVKAKLGNCSNANPSTPNAPKREPISRELHSLDCVLCFKLMLEPVSTSCGHSFCKSCLQQALDHSTKCPACRKPLALVPSSLCVNYALRDIISSSFPEEYARRQQEESTPTVKADASSVWLPIFVIGVLLPGQTVGLQIFEPRYRLMIRRVLEGSGRFGLFTRASSASSFLCEYGTEVRIDEARNEADGRYLIQVQGTRIAHLESETEEDGYVLGNVSYPRDEDDGDESVAPYDQNNDQETVKQLFQRAEHAAEELLERLQATLSSSEYSRLQAAIGNKPPWSGSANGRSSFSFWLARLAEDSVLSDSTSAGKVEMISERSPARRVKYILDMLESAISRRSTIRPDCTVS